jgi:hypothetical protein
MADRFASQTKPSPEGNVINLRADRYARRELEGNLED